MTTSTSSISSLKERSRHYATHAERRSFIDWISDPNSWFSIASFLGPLLLYMFTLAPTVTLEDSGEFITAAYNLGIPHPPGYPLWCILAHLFTWIPVGNIAERVHLFSAVSAAGTCLVTYLICHRLTGDRWASLIGAWALGVSRYFWSQAVIAEVYTLNALMIALAVWSILEWKATKRIGWIYSLALMVGLGAANHFLVLLFTPIYAVWVLVPDWRQILRPRVLLIATSFLVLGLSLYLYLPVRAYAHPVPNMMGTGTLEEIRDHVLRTAYSTGKETIRQGGDLSDGLRHSASAFRRHLEAFTPFILLFVALGMIQLFRSNRGYLAASIAIWLFNDVLTNVLLKERFNTSWDFVHRVYYIPADVIWATWIAAGVALLFQFFSEPSRNIIRIAAIAGIVGIGISNLNFCNRRNEVFAEQLGQDILRGLPKNSRILPNDDLVYVILYLTKVAGVRPDVQIGGPHFGFKPTKEDGFLYSFTPVTPVWREYLEDLANAGWRPAGLMYQLTPTKAIIERYEQFKPIDPPPTLPGPMVDPNDVMDRFARAMVANYYARLGAKEFVTGNKEGAEKAWDIAESIADKPYPCYQLATIYRDLKVRTDRIEPLLRKALELHEQFYDPAAERFAPVSKEEIEQFLGPIAPNTPAK